MSDESDEQILTKLVDAHLKKELEFTDDELKRYRLEAKLEMLGEAVINNFMITLFAKKQQPENVARTKRKPEDTPEPEGRGGGDLSKDVWVVIAAKLRNRDYTTFGNLNKKFRRLFFDHEFIDRVLLKRHGAAYDQVAFSKRLDPRRYNDPFLRLRVFEIVLEIWFPQKRIRSRVPGRQEKVFPAATFFNLQLEHPKTKYYVIFQPQSNHNVADIDGSILMNYYLVDPDGHGIRSDNTVLREFHSILQDTDVFNKDIDYVADYVTNRAALEATIYKFMAAGFNVIKEFQIEYFQRPADHNPVETTDNIHDFKLLFSHLCANCAESAPLVTCGNACYTAYYCNQACADQHYAKHDCIKKI